MLGTKKYAKAINDRKELDPADYDFKGEYYVGPSEEVADAYSYARWDDDIDVANERLGHCEHCGTSHYHGAIFHNNKTGEFLVIGNVCASSFFDFPSRKAYFERQAQLAKKAKKEREEAAEKRAAFLADKPQLVEDLKVDHHIINDIDRRLTKWGSLTDRQCELVAKIAEEERNRVPEPKPEPIPADVLDGRVRITGVVLGTKWVENDWGGNVKLLVRDDRGFKVWGSAPDMCVDFKGCRVAFDARVEVSNDDECFGFYSRPTKWDVEESEDDDR